MTKEEMLQIVKDSKASSESLAQLINTEDMDILSRLAEHPNTPVHVLEQLSKRTEFIILLRLCCNKNTPTNVLEMLCKHPDSTIRKEIAKRAGVDESIQIRLAKKEREDDVLIALAENLSISAKTAKVLSKNLCDEAVKRLARNKHTPVEVAISLAKNHVKADVRAAAMYHPGLSLKFLRRRFWRDTNIKVRGAIMDVKCIRLKEWQAGDEAIWHAKISAMTPKELRAYKKTEEYKNYDTMSKEILKTIYMDYE